MVTERRLPVTLGRWVAVQQVAAFSRRQWKVAGWSYLAALLIMGVAGETLPGASTGRVVPIQWWNYVTLVLSPPLIALIAATFVPPGQPRRGRRWAKTGTGAAGAAGTLAMACPVCNLIALLSIVLLAVTLLIRLRTTRACQLAPQAGPSSGSPR
jgi:hypothetical protein